MSPPCLHALKASCDEIGCPKTAAKELFRALIVSHLDLTPHHLYKASCLFLALSAQLQQLLDWTIRNEERKTIFERDLGPIRQLTASDLHPTECKLALMTAISRFGWQPNLSLWEDGSERIMAVRLTSPASGDQFEMFYTRDHGHVPFLQRDPELICNEVDTRRTYATVRQKAARSSRSSAVQGCEDQVQLFLKTITGKTERIEPISLDATVAHLKLAVEDLVKIPIDQQRLTFGGRQLADSHTLRESVLKNEGTIHLALRLRGC